MLDHRLRRSTNIEITVAGWLTVNEKYPHYVQYGVIDQWNSGSACHMTRSNHLRHSVGI